MNAQCWHDGGVPPLPVELKGGLLCAVGVANLLLGSAVPPRVSVAASSGALCGLVMCVALAIAEHTGTGGGAAGWACAGAVLAAVLAGGAVGYRWWLWVLDALQLVSLLILCTAADRGGALDQWDTDAPVPAASFLLAVAFAAVVSGGASLLLGLVIVCPYSAIPVAVLVCGVGIIAQLAGCVLRSSGCGRRGSDAETRRLTLAVNEL